MRIKESPVLKGFREFILRGNVIDLAVGIIIGAAFTAIVTALVSGIFNPLIGVLFNSSDLTKAFQVTIPALGGGKPGVIQFGAVLAAIIQFLIVALVVYFAIVLPINHLGKLAFAKQKAQVEATPAELPPTETELLIQIRDLLAGAPSPEGDHTQPSTGSATASTGSHAAR
jgi:large conductance mechanosensitive channel